MEEVFLKKVDNNYIKIICEPGILEEISDEFTFYKKNYKYHPKFKNKMWDGKIRLVNRMSGTIYAGLAQRVLKFCQSRGYNVTFDDDLIYDNVSVHEFKTFLKELNLPDWVEIRPYQINSVVKCIRSKRRTLLSPTSSGKSLIIYLLARWYNKKTLIIVPSTGLVKQLASDFVSYGYNEDIHSSTDILNHGLIEENITITTWQSIDNGKYSVPSEWYKQFDVVFCDEAHGAQATQLIKIMTNLKDVAYRFGTTGTIQDDPLSELTIEGLFGPQYTATTTRELIDDGYASDLTIKIIQLRYTDSESKELFETYKLKKLDSAKKYKHEIDFITRHSKRNDFIVNLTLSLEGNKLVFFRFEEHGRELERLFRQKTNQPVFYIDGSISANEREKIREQIESEENSILVASIGTTSTGISIKRLHHMIAAMPMKSKIKVLQSIGRMLRQHKTKQKAILYDIVDDLHYGKMKNMILLQMEDRIKHYDNEKHNYKIYRTKLI